MTMRARSLELNLVNTEAVGAADIDGRNRALRALDLLPTGGPGPPPPENPAAPKAGTLLIYLTDLLSHPDAANKIEEVRMCRTHPWVMIVAADGQRVIYRPPNEKHTGTKDYMTGGREEYVIGAGVLFIRR